MLNNSIELPMSHLLSARHLTCLGDDVAASVLDNFRANLSRLLETLKSSGVSHEEFASRLGVAPQKVSQWKGGVFPRPKQIDEIAKALGVSSEALFRESVSVDARDLEAAVRNLADSLGFELKPKN